MIPSTHLSLLYALKDSGLREAAMSQFQSRYRDTIFRWCLRQGLQPADAEDVTQTVFLRLLQVLPNHQHDQDRPFRNWLKAVVNNAIIDLRRGEGRRPGDRGVGGSNFQDQLAKLVQPESLDDLAEAIEGNSDPELAAAIERVKSRVAEGTWQAFWRVAVDGRSAAEVAAELGMSVGSVFKAKYRVSRLFAKEYAP
jgi:RNA polymerase sigma-70 factor (ECF subfamily)